MFYSGSVHQVVHSNLSQMQRLCKFVLGHFDLLVWGFCPEKNDGHVILIIRNAKNLLFSVVPLFAIKVQLPSLKLLPVVEDLFEVLCLGVMQGLKEVLLDVVI